MDLSPPVSLRWNLDTASLVGQGAARSAAGTLPAGFRPGSRPPVRPPLWSRVQQPAAPAVPGHPAPTQRRVRDKFMTNISLPDEYLDRHEIRKVFGFYLAN